jgi:OOP family OmpA-OmpF porin
MKKLGLAAVAVSAVAIASSANAFQYTPYVGADYAFSYVNPEGWPANSKPQYSGVNVNVGTNFNQYFGTELFYQITGGQHKRRFDGTNTLKTNYQAWGLDLMGYLPFGCEGTFSLIGTAGVGAYYFSHKLDGVTNRGHDEAVGYRFGVGAIYNVTENWSVRSLVRYVSVDRSDVLNVDHLWEWSAGIRYNF